MIKLLFTSSLILFTTAYVLQKGNGERKDFYEIDNLNVTEHPDIHYVDSTEKTMNKLMFEVISPKPLQDNVISKEDFKDYVIIKAKRQMFDVSPYVMMRQLDDIKYMVVWLNLYCEMHPDCNRDTLNEELNKVVYGVGKETK